MTITQTARTGEVAQINAQTVLGWVKPPEDDADWVLWRLGTQASMYSDRKRAQVMRGVLRLCRREDIPLRHGTVKHARDLVRYLEKHG